MTSSISCKMPLHVNIGKHFYSNRFTWCYNYQRSLNKIDGFANKLGISHGLIFYYFYRSTKELWSKFQEKLLSLRILMKNKQKGSKLSENSHKINQQQTILATFSMWNNYGTRTNYYIDSSWTRVGWLHIDWPKLSSIWALYLHQLPCWSCFFLSFT